MGRETNWPIPLEKEITRTPPPPCEKATFATTCVDGKIEFSTLFCENIILGLQGVNL